MEKAPVCSQKSHHLDPKLLPKFGKVDDKGEGQHS